MTTKNLSNHPHTTPKDIFQEVDIAIALQEADEAAQTTTQRLTHEEVFSSLSKIINSYPHNQ